MAAASLDIVNSASGTEQGSVGAFRERDIRVLIIDDNPVNIRLISQQLHYFGCQADGCNSGEAGINMWQLNDYSIIFIDCHMPGMDGAEVIARVTSSSKYALKRPKLIAFSADSSSATAKQYLSNGADFFAVKPVALDGLHRVLQQCVDGPVGDVTALRSFTGESTAAAIKENVTSAKVVDISYLKSILGNDPLKLDAHHHLAGIFSNEAPHVLRAMLAANELHDKIQLGHLAHKFKSSARSVGAERVALACELLEASLADYSELDVANILFEFETLLSEVKEYWAT